jgi:alkyl hydroperoxide reductase subunit AhpC
MMNLIRLKEKFTSLNGTIIKFSIDEEFGVHQWGGNVELVSITNLK